jgi:hypothetical protein
LVRLADSADPFGPNLLPALDIESQDELVLKPPITDQVDAVSDDGRRRIPIANVIDFP